MLAFANMLPLNKRCQDGFIPLYSPAIYHLCKRVSAHRSVRRNERQRRWSNWNDDCEPGECVRIYR